MKFNLQINPDWKVFDAATGLQVKRVLWVDDETHNVAQCRCAMTCDKSPIIAAVVGDGDEVYNTCSERNEHIKAMPKVKIDQPRKTVLVNVNDEIKPEAEDMYVPAPPIRRAILILA